jgi:hypothetical protein
MNASDVETFFEAAVGDWDTMRLIYCHLPSHPRKRGTTAATSGVSSQTEKRGSRRRRSITPLAAVTPLGPLRSRSGSLGRDRVGDYADAPRPHIACLLS